MGDTPSQSLNTAQKNSNTSENSKTTTATCTKNFSKKSFSKDQFLAYKEYANKKDLISSLLQEGIFYSKEDVKKIIDNYLKGEI